MLPLCYYQHLFLQTVLTPNLHFHRVVRSPRLGMKPLATPLLPPMMPPASPPPMQPQRRNSRELRSGFHLAQYWATAQTLPELVRKVQRYGPT